MSRRQSTSDAESDLGTTLDTVPSLRSFGSTRSGDMTGPRPSLESSSTERKEGEPTGGRAAMAPEQRIEDIPRLPFAFERWDPMSCDIETASYLILAGDASIAPSSPITNDWHKGLEKSKTSLGFETSGHDRPSSLACEQKHSNIVVQETKEINVASKSDSEELTGLESLRSHSTGLDPGIFDTTPIHGQVEPPKITDTPTSLLDTKPRYRIVNADPSEIQDECEDESQPVEQRENIVPDLPKKNPRRAFQRNSPLAAHKRLARVYSDDDADGIDLNREVLETLRTSSQSPDLKPTSHVPSPALGTVRDLTRSFTQAWNDGDMDQAEFHLQDLLKLRPQPNSESTLDRRVRHLLGVLASLKGKWGQALELFASALSTPLVDVVDAGSCAATYWMGDIYALTNRRTEALIAYSIVEQGLKNGRNSTAISPQLLQRLRAEQKLCQSGNDKPHFESQLHSMTHESGSTDKSSILNSHILTRVAAQKFLDSVQWPPETTHIVESHQSRASSLSLDSTTLQDLQKLQLSASALASSAPWPMPFDPLFASANIACGLPSSNECDLLQLKTIPRMSSSLGRFTCQDLHWLLNTLRACMKRLELKYTEFADGKCTWLIPHYSSTDGAVTSTHFISISIFRLKFRSGFGVEICPDGKIFSSRITSLEAKSVDGGHAHELKRIKKLIRNYLDAALRRQEAEEDRQTVIPVMSINGVTSIQREFSSKGKKAASVGSSSPATSSRSGSLFN